MTADLFLDTSYAIALSSATDLHHDEAVRMATRIETDDRHLVATRLVVVEIGNALSKIRHRASAATLLHALENDPRVEIVPLSEELYVRGLDLYAQHQDKEWGMTDRISFVVMRERSMAEALTADDHFRQAGLRPRLLTV